MAEAENDPPGHAVTRPIPCRSIGLVSGVAHMCGVVGPRSNDWATGHADKHHANAADLLPPTPISQDARIFSPRPCATSIRALHSRRHA